MSQPPGFDFGKDRSTPQRAGWTSRLVGMLKATPRAAKEGQPIPGGVMADAILFFEEIAAIPTGTGRVAPPVAWGDQTAHGHLWKATLKQGKTIPEAERWWTEATKRLVRRFPDADRYALEWLCDIVGRHAQLARLRGPQWANGYHLDATLDWLRLWALRRPVEGGTTRIEAALGHAIPPAVHGDPPWQTNQSSLTWLNSRALEHLVGFLAVISSGDDFLDRARRLMDQTLAVEPGGTHGRPIQEFLLRAFAIPLWQAGRLEQHEQTELVLTAPSLVRLLDRPGMPVSVREGIHALFQSLIARVAEDGKIDRRTQNAVFAFQRYAGFHDFFAAIRWLEGAAGARNGAWAAHVLQRLPPPAPEDLALLPGCAAVWPETLFVGGVFAPAWAGALERAELGQELAGIGGFARWAARHLGPSPWALDWEGNRRAEWETATVVADRVGLENAVAANGPARIRRVLDHPLLRSHARIARLCLAAALGENAAEVEAKFLRRDKWAVVALGMLPDEGDVADRYLALRRFAHEAKKSGPQRGVSETVAVQIALAHLAVTGGYESIDALEWAIETELAAGVEPTAQRWSIGGYDVWVELDEGASVRIERGGKALKSVPAAIRKTSEYAEAKDARDLLVAQAERVRRRLERAMVSGEVLDRAAYDQLLGLPAGRLYLPRLVLSVWLPGHDAPIQVLDGRTLGGEAVVVEGEVRVQIAHPLHLAATATLDGWQRRFVAAGGAQPINQLFRGVYEPTDEELASQICRRFQGRKVKLGALRRALLNAGWEVPSYYAGLVRRFVPPAVAELTLTDWVTIAHGDEAVTLGELGFHGRDRGDRLPALDPRWFAETVRDVDLATTVAQTDSLGAGNVSPERRAVRAQLVRALVPATTIDGDLVRLLSGAVHLATGAAFDASGNVLVLPDPPVPAAFPCLEPDPTTATIVARAVTLAAVGT